MIAHAPWVNFVIAITTVTTPVTDRAGGVDGETDPPALLLEADVPPAMPACDSVNDVNTPMA